MSIRCRIQVGRLVRWTVVLAVAATVWGVVGVHSSRDATADDLPGTQSVAGSTAAQRPTRAANPRRGFDLKRTAIPREEILSGGPPKDGIPAITNPRVIAWKEADHMAPAERVAGLEIGGEARAYPLKILTRHEVVNDRLGDVPIAVTYCPLCDSTVVFDRRVASREIEFGVSGLLYNSNVLMYDRGGKPEALWSQLMARSVSGPAARASLKIVPFDVTTWKNWTARHPQSTVLTVERPQAYSRNPYARYFSSRDLMFPVKAVNDQLPLKEPVLGLWTEGGAKSYPLSLLAKVEMPVEGELDGKKFRLTYDADADSVHVDKADDGLRWAYAFWFAWYAFHPNTTVVTQTNGPSNRQLLPSKKGAKARASSLQRLPASDKVGTARSKEDLQNSRVERIDPIKSRRFAGKRLVVWSQGPIVIETIFPADNPLWQMLSAKGLSIRLESGTFSRDLLDQADQLWIFSARRSSLDKESLQDVVEFARSGRGLYLLADNEPFVAEADALARLMFDSEISGNYDGDKVIRLERTGNSDRDDDVRRNIVSSVATPSNHPVLDDLPYLYEGYTVSHIKSTEKLEPVLYASDGQILAASARDSKLKVVLDCGWTRYHRQLVRDASGTLKYAENMTAYLFRMRNH